MSTLKLFVFGPPRLELNGATVDIQRRKALALLVYLAVSGQPHSRDSLATLFYPDSDQSRARAYLRRDLALLNTTLAGAWLLADRETVELNSGYWLDMAHFQQLLAACRQHDHPPESVCSDCLPHLNQAAQLHADDFLAGFTLRDSAEFDDWQFFQAETLRQELASVLERLVIGLGAGGDYKAAIPIARRWLALDPLHEPAQRHLIQIYDQADQPAAALRQYEEYVELLEEELGLPPAEETTTLYEAIKAKRMLGSYIKTVDKSQLSPAPLPARSEPVSPAKTAADPPDRQTGLAAAARQREAKDYVAAISTLKLLLAHYPADESIHRELMGVLALAGRRHEALRQYQSCVETLAAHQTAPTPETAALYRQIVSGEDISSPAAPPPLTAIEVERSGPLFGRESELEELMAKIRGSGGHHQGRTILLSGDSGVGKTRLASEGLREAALAGMVTLVGTAYEQEGYLAYQPFIEAIDRYLSEQHRPPEQNPITHYQPLGSSDPQQEHTALVNATASFLTSLASQAPVILLVDDLHAADEASLGLFHYLARQTRSAPVVLVATYRTDLAPEGNSAFASLINALYRERLSQVIHLHPLPEQAGGEIIGHILTGSVDPTLVQLIVETAEGNPFFVQEITRAMLKAGRLQEENGLWRLQAGAAPKVPSELRELLRERVQRLGPTVESALSAAAVIGREFRFPLLQAVTDLPDGQLLDAIDAALNAHLLEETEDGYRFHHSLVRHTLYDSLSRARRAWLHIRTAEAIESLDAARAESGQPVAEALAFHYERSERSEQRERALPYLLQAGQKAARVYALEIAIDHYQRALTLMDDLKLNNPAQRWQILEQLGWWTLTIANTAQAVSYLEAALALAPTDDWQPTINDRVRLHRLIARTLISAGHAAVAEEHLLVAMEIAADNALVSADYAQLLYEVAMWYWHRNEYQEAYEVAQRGLEVATRLNNPEAIGNAYEVLALCCHSLGEWQQGLAYEQQRAALVGSDLDVTIAYDVHL